MTKDKDLEMILELLIIKNEANFQEIFRFLGNIGRRTIYKKLRFLVENKIIQRLNYPFRKGKSYFLGSDGVIISQILGFGSRKEIIQMKKQLLQRPIKMGLISRRKAFSLLTLKSQGL